jgi:hypothetical protein
MEIALVENLFDNEHVSRIVFDKQYIYRWLRNLVLDVCLFTLSGKER